MADNTMDLMSYVITDLDSGKEVDSNGKVLAGPVSSIISGLIGIAVKATSFFINKKNVDRQIAQQQRTDEIYKNCSMILLKLYSGYNQKAYEIKQTIIELRKAEDQEYAEKLGGFTVTSYEQIHGGLVNDGFSEFGFNIGNGFESFMVAINSEIRNDTDLSVIVKKAINYSERLAIYGMQLNLHEVYGAGKVPTGKYLFSMFPIDAPLSMNYPRDPDTDIGGPNWLPNSIEMQAMMSIMIELGSPSWMWRAVFNPTGAGRSTLVKVRNSTDKVFEIAKVQSQNDFMAVLRIVNQYNKNTFDQEMVLVEERKRVALLEAQKKAEEEAKNIVVVDPVEESKKTDPIITAGKTAAQIKAEHIASIQKNKKEASSGTVASSQQVKSNPNFWDKMTTAQKVGASVAAGVTAYMVAK